MSRWFFSLPALLAASSALAQPCLPPLCTAFPADAGIVNVRDYGAKGDGTSDDTQAINAALAASGGDTGAAFWQDRIVYFPSGTYLVSGTLAKRYKEGRFASGSLMVGQGRDTTVIRLKDHAPGYDSPENPKSVIFTSAKLLDGNATSGGKDYTNKGEGNDAFMNYVENLTVDVGAGNTGAVGIDYLANNQGAIRNVLVRAPKGSGAVGIALNRKWPGPALLQDITIQGFATGIASGHTEYGLTLERITLAKQRAYGIRNDKNVLAIRDLTVTGAPVPVSNASPEGLVVIDKAMLEGASVGTQAFANEGYMVLRSVKVNLSDAFNKPVGETLDGVYRQNELLKKVTQPWSLPVKDAPQLPADDPAAWVSVAAYGAKADSGEDASAAIAKAFASGASTVYFPHGIYLISGNIAVPASVRRIVGMTSTIRSHPSRPPSFKRDRGMLEVSSEGESLTIERLAFDNSYQGDQVAVGHDGKRTLVLRDVVGAGVTTLARSTDGGEAFIENTCCGTLSLAGKNGVWARQLDTEGPGVRIDNNGAPLWVLGLKTEKNCTVLYNYNGARSEILGGLVYITGTKAEPAMPAFRNRDSQLLLSYAEESFAAAATYSTHLEDSQQGRVRSVEADELPKRAIGRMVPLLVSGD